MIQGMNKTVAAILAVLDRSKKPVNSGEVTKSLALQGIDVSERTVRHYLKQLDALGYTEGVGKRGRMITDQGKQELYHGFVSERVGFIINRINSLSFLSDFRPESRRGKVILNVTFVPESAAAEALSILRLVLDSPYSMSNRIVLAKAGEHLGDLVVPPGFLGIGTLCTMTLNGIFLKAGIPVTSRFGGVVEVACEAPTRFLAAISYEGSSVPPLEVFIKSRMTDVLGVLRYGTGRILGSFREIPEISLRDARRVNEEMKRCGFGGIILFGQPGRHLLGLPVTTGKVGMVVLGGLNPVAALEEAGIPTKNQALATLVDYPDLSPIEDAELSCLGRGCIRSADFLEGAANDRLRKENAYWSVFGELKQITL